MTSTKPELTIKRVPVDQLLLDPKNPRLALASGATDQVELVRLLWQNMAVDEVALSIAVNGWFENKHLIVIPAAAPKGSYIVVEGNRRLAAVKLLRDPKLRERVGVPGSWITPEQPLPEELPVEVHQSREELWQYMGFEHVNGVRPWDSFSKAAYVWHVHEAVEGDLDRIAESIGDRYSTVKRLYLGYAALQQARSRGVFDMEEPQGRFAFSHLYTALDYREFREYLGITAASAITSEPVPPDRVPHLERVMRWLYGGKGASPVIRTQNPDLKYLRTVLGEPKAVARLEETNDLQGAYLVAYGETAMFGEALAVAQQRLKYAMTLVSTAYDRSDGPREMVREIRKMADDLLKLMEDQPQG
jgi:hypothetical protein